ncbi:enoyl-CoA hydratase/isomerase family protein [Gracilimonas mengyeensis]|uniref:Enoyl-CoA hydratase/carnithine racemase n=1 Tax=Gracilimonas mengyeensis TaxID=1302730 RepID=A0A521CFU6_9BACT|nr:enoyl-CoA hydratase/isomerase family protein [Gracilimonas mengyeensis]SMO58317.1 Enoyl-CoA hydratase/carnithine racemase [Gracilimonas mengyeensis]
MVLTQKRISDHILWANINRPKALNAIDFEVLDELEKLVQKVEEDEDIRVLILSGSGDNTFVSGGDLKKFHTIKEKDKMVGQAQRIQDLLFRIEELPCWTVAHINGDAYGGGIELMLAFDFRLSVPDAKFGFTQGRFYLVPGWGGMTRLVEKVGRTKALEWQGKSEVLEAHKVLAHGMIEHILLGDHPEKETLAWVEALTQNDRKYIRTLKENAFRISAARREALEAETEPFAELWVDEQHLSRVEDFMNKGK